LPLAATALVSAVLAANPGNGQRTFATPQEAGRAVLVAAESENMPALSRIFGPESDEILHSGDAVADRNARAAFVKRAKQSLKGQIDPSNANRARLLIGADNFAFPIPLVKTAGRWHFDTPSGKTEILARRIGANELDAIAACKAYVDAQYDYATEDRNKNGIPEYARKLISSPGERDGLFWPGSDTPDTQFASRLETAESEGYRKHDDAPAPYHGYYFRILMAQGPNARGGAQEYVHDGSMIGGFGLIAWPAEHGVSGIQTFVVNHDGAIYEKDLGSKTSAAAQAITTFDPDRTWRRVR
jgi:Protein of unknown function (DUF2950)